MAVENRLFDSFLGRPIAVATQGRARWSIRTSKGENDHHVERVDGKFERSVQLPMPVQAEKVKATYRDGVLEVKLPKSEEIKPKEIKIDIL